MPASHISYYFRRLGYGNTAQVLLSATKFSGQRISHDRTAFITFQKFWLTRHRAWLVFLATKYEHDEG